MKRPGPHRPLSDKLRAVYQYLNAAAEAGLPCPSNQQVSEACGYSALTGPARAFVRLQGHGLISVTHTSNGRTVTICATGKRITTAPMGRIQPIAADSGRTVRKDSRGITAAMRQRSIMNAAERHELEASLPRVDRDPCPRCQVRRDIGCAHRASRLTTGAYA